MCRRNIWLRDSFPDSTMTLAPSNINGKQQFRIKLHINNCDYNMHTGVPLPVMKSECVHINKIPRHEHFSIGASSTSSLLILSHLHGPKCNIGNNHRGPLLSICHPRYIYQRVHALRWLPTPCAKIIKCRVRMDGCGSAHALKNHLRGSKFRPSGSRTWGPAIFSDQTCASVCRIQCPTVNSGEFASKKHLCYSKFQPSGSRTWGPAIFFWSYINATVCQIRCTTINSGEFANDLTIELHFVCIRTWYSTSMISLWSYDFQSAQIQVTFTHGSTDGCLPTLHVVWLVFYSPDPNS